MISTTYKSPIGRLTLVSNGKALIHLEFENNKYPAPKFPKGEDKILKQACKELDAYFAGKLREFETPVEPQGTAFQRQAWKALAKIPYGKTRSYGEQAAAIGKPKAVRAIGLANGRNPIPIIIPCHRVIGANGSLTGFGGGIEVKRYLLDLEQGDTLIR